MKRYTTVALAFIMSMAVSCSKKMDLSADNAEENASLQRNQMQAASLAASSVIVTTIAGGSSAGTEGNQDGTGDSATFWGLRDMAMGSDGNLYITDNWRYFYVTEYYSKIRKVTPAGTVTTLNFIKADSTETIIHNPLKLAIDADGNIYYTDGHRIRKMTPDGYVSTLAGDSQQGYADGQGTQARFSWPKGLTTDAAGNVYVVDQTNSRIRKITPSGWVTTIAGNGDQDSKDGNGTKASFLVPKAITIDAQGNLYVTEQARVRKITPKGRVTTLAGGSSTGDLDGQGTMALLNNPEGITVDLAGNLYIADAANVKVKKITPDGVVTTIAGSSPSYGPVDGTGETAKFYSMNGIALDPTQNILYVNDYYSVRKVTF